jgi:hypothetical protein
MDTEATEDPRTATIEDLGRRYRALLGAVPEPVAAVEEAVWNDLDETQQALDDARVRQQQQVQDAGRQDAETSNAPLGTLLGPETTGLTVTTSVLLQPIPTGIYNLLDPKTDPLLTITLRNESHEPRRVCVTAYLEGLTARAIQTVELERLDKGRTIALLPSLLPGSARRITQVQRATMHIIVTIFGSLLEKSRTTWPKLVESHDTQSVVLLSRNSSFNAVTDPTTGKLRDLSKYYGAWVTPHIEPIQDLLHAAAERVPERQIWGYQGDDHGVVTRQVEGLFNALKEAGINYVNSIIDFGAGSGMLTQRTRLPRETLKHGNANCLDGTVLFASLLESASLHAGLVLVPGHAFVAWEKWCGTDEWDYLETTMIDTDDFSAANAEGRKCYKKWFARKSRVRVDLPPRLLKLNDLRAAGIWPME